MSNLALSHALEDVLEKEYKALLSGSLDEIEAFGIEKTEILERIGGLSERDMAEFIVFREKLFRNQALAESAIAGMRKAITRTKAVTDVSTGLRTYGPNGEEKRVATKASRALFKRS